MSPTEHHPFSSSSTPTFIHRFFFGHGGAALLGGLCEIIVFHPFDTIAKRLMNHRERVVDPKSLPNTYHNIGRVVFGGLLEKKKKNAVPPSSALHRNKEVPISSLGGGGTASANTVIRLTILDRIQYLYPGSTYAVLYKVSQRVIKFAGQPMFREYLHTHYHHLFFSEDPPASSSSAVPEKLGDVRHSNTGTGEMPQVVKKGHPPKEGEPHVKKVVIVVQQPHDGTQNQPKRKKDGGRGGMALELTSGCLIGISETVLLPFDRMKILHQTNSTAMQQNRGLLSSFWAYGPRKLYAGAVTTAFRNAVGTSLFFACTALSKEYLFGLHSGNYKETTFAQNLIASTVGGVVGVVATSPMDVVKTRIQGQRLDGTLSGRKIFLETCKKEGFGAFYKGITPKVLTSAPKLVFGYTMTQFFLKYLKD